MFIDNKLLCNKQYSFCNNFFVKKYKKKEKFFSACDQMNAKTLSIKKTI